MTIKTTSINIIIKINKQIQLNSKHNALDEHELFEGHVVVVLIPFIKNKFINNDEIKKKKYNFKPHEDIF